MRQQWTALTNQHAAATDPAARLAVEGQMDELITSSNYNTTALAVLQEPLFSENAQAEVTPEAARFVINLMSSTDLMTKFSQVVAAPVSSVDAYNAAITQFLQQQGYSCPALQVISAFIALRNKSLVYWSGSYTSWVTNDGGVSYGNSSARFRAAAAAATGTAPTPELGPVLVVSQGGVTLDGTSIAGYAYNNNSLTWASDGGNAAAGAVQFATVTRPTINDSFLGDEFFGTITYPAGGPRSGTYSFYGRAPGQPGAPGSADRSSYTLAYVLSALGLVALAAMLAGYRWVRQRNDRLTSGQEQRARDNGDYVNPDGLQQVASRGRVQEAAFLSGQLVRRRVRAAADSLQELATYEPAMELADRARLASGSQSLRDSGSELEDPPAARLASTAQNANKAVDIVLSDMQGITDSLGSALSAQSKTAIEDSTRLADNISTVIDDVTQDARDDKPIEFTENIES